MPNWCSTNYCVLGEEKELNKLAETINSLPNRKSVAPNGFGPMWLGNFVAAFGRNWKDFNVRGTIEATPDAPAYFCGPAPDTNMKAEVIDGKLRFTITSAYSPCEDIEKLICTEFPSLCLLYRTCDDMGNFFLVNDPQDIACFDRYNLVNEHESLWYTKSEKEQFMKDLRETCPGLEVPSDICENKQSHDEFASRFCEWRDKQKNGDFIGFAIYQQI